MFDPDSLPKREYSYLLGFYLGDGVLSRHRRNVYRLRIKTDSLYPAIIGECAAATQAVMPANRVLIQQMRYRAVEIGCFCDACDRLRIAYTFSSPKTVSIARAPSVALLDSFVGPKT